ncbi:hypothetical protein PoB_007557700 [Plakobranchus ocellatus]|uniref:Uncharacterized protein n=1 Tax=Plakobranchus ocellatus TaxID=259542 RepID=A0AAV4DYH0_9GAST|nr:hypothetical protein PoB_007557700 [Plakobranchus ocellatus]
MINPSVVATIHSNPATSLLHIYFANQKFLHERGRAHTCLVGKGPDPAKVMYLWMLVMYYFSARRCHILHSQIAKNSSAAFRGEIPHGDSEVLDSALCDITI